MGDADSAGCGNVLQFVLKLSHFAQTTTSLNHATLKYSKTR
jgi:hypothetical protein